VFSDLEQSVGHLFINFSPVPDGEDPDNSRFAIQFVNDAKASDFDSPQSRQFSDKRRTGEWIGA
jgi:hypothetical protein